MEEQGEIVGPGEGRNVRGRMEADQIQGVEPVLPLPAPVAVPQPQLQLQPIAAPVDPNTLTPAAFARTLQPSTIIAQRLPVGVLTGAARYFAENIASIAQTAENLVSAPLTPLTAFDNPLLQRLAIRVAEPIEIDSSQSPFTIAMRASERVKRLLYAGLIHGLVIPPAPAGFLLDSGSLFAILGAVFRIVKGKKNKKETAKRIVCSCGRELKNLGGSTGGNSPTCLPCSQYVNLQNVPTTGGTDITREEHFVLTSRQTSCMTCSRPLSLDFKRQSGIGSPSLDCYYPCTSAGRDPSWNHNRENIGCISCYECNIELHAQKPWNVFLLDVVSLREAFGDMDIIGAMDGCSQVPPLVLDQLNMIEEEQRSRLASAELLAEKADSDIPNPFAEHTSLFNHFACKKYRANDKYVETLSLDFREVHDIYGHSMTYGSFMTILRSGHRGGHIANDDGPRRSKCHTSKKNCEKAFESLNAYETSIGRRLDLNIGSSTIKEASAGRPGPGMLSCSNCWMPAGTHVYDCSSRMCTIADLYHLDTFHFRAMLQAGLHGHSCIICNLSAEEFNILHLYSETTGGSVGSFNVDAGHPPNSHLSFMNLFPMCYTDNHCKGNYGQLYSAAMRASGLPQGPFDSVPGARVKLQYGCALSVEDASNVALAANHITSELLGGAANLAFAKRVAGEIAVAAAKVCFEAFPVVGNEDSLSTLEARLAQVVYDVAEAGMVAFANGQNEIAHGARRQNAADLASVRMLASIEAIHAAAQINPGGFDAFINKDGAGQLAESSLALRANMQTSATPPRFIHWMNEEHSLADAVTTAETARNRALEVTFNNAMTAAIAAKDASDLQPASIILKNASDDAWMLVASARLALLKAREEIKRRRLVGPVRHGSRPLGQGSNKFVKGSFGMSSAIENYDLGDFHPLPHYVKRRLVDLVNAERIRLMGLMSQLKKDTDYILRLAADVVNHQSGLAAEVQSPFFKACVAWRTLYFV